MGIVPDVRRQAGRAFVVGACCLAMGAGEPEKPISERLQGFATPEEHPVKAELIAEHASLQRGGRTRVGVLFTIREGWHIYADPPGDAGLPTRIKWTCAAVDAVEYDFDDIPCPDDVFGPVTWPAPTQFLDPGDIRTFGYAGTVLLSSTLSAPTVMGAGLRIHADVEWLACKDVCIPGSATLQFSLPVRAEPPIPSAHAALFGPAS